MTKFFATSQNKFGNLERRMDMAIFLSTTNLDEIKILRYAENKIKFTLNNKFRFKHQITLRIINSLNECSE